MKFYAGIGSRQTPSEICEMMHKVAYKLAEFGWVLRSGAAEGADQAFQYGVEKYCEDYGIPCRTRQQIFLPWIGFNNFGIESDRGICWRDPVDDPRIEQIARYFHPKYEQLGRGAKKLIGRNGHQILGWFLDSPVAMVIAWTPDGSVGKTTPKTGGTGHALRIAYNRRIPIYNLANNATKMLIEWWLENPCEFI